jgi:D-3-phosphoglycerate dehydrogenase / 2-oxoglutarate reductase
MSYKRVFIALQQFCEMDDRPLRVLSSSGLKVHMNPLGRRIRQDELPKLLQDSDAVIAGVEPYDAALLSSLPRLRCISRVGSGTDTIDLEVAREQGISVFVTREEVVEPVAQLTVAMILALARNLHLHTRDFDRGLWKKRIGHLISEWTIGLVGFGQIGRAVQRMLRSFGPRILISDPYVESEQLPEGVECCELPLLLSQSDLISLHASRSPQKGVLIGQKEMKLMKRGSYLINTSRGFLLDQQALYGALTSGHLAGAALDVFESEPDTGPLSRMPQVIGTPHVATLTRASRMAMELRSAEQIVQFFSKGVNVEHRV